MCISGDHSSYSIPCSLSLTEMHFIFWKSGDEVVTPRAAAPVIEKTISITLSGGHPDDT